MLFSKLPVAFATIAAHAVGAEPFLTTRNEDIAQNNTNPVAKSFIVEYKAVRTSGPGLAQCGGTD